VLNDDRWAGHFFIFSFDQLCNIEQHCPRSIQFQYVMCKRRLSFSPRLAGSRCCAEPNPRRCLSDGDKTMLRAHTLYSERNNGKRTQSHSTIIWPYKDNNTTAPDHRYAFGKSERLANMLLTLWIIGTTMTFTVHVIYRAIRRRIHNHRYMINRHQASYTRAIISAQHSRHTIDLTVR
jgi:hypothetical protein